MKKIDLLKRVDHLLTLGQGVLATGRKYDFQVHVDKGLQMGFRTGSLSFIKSLYGDNHIFYQDFNTQVMGQYNTATQSGINILNAIRHEIDQDWLTTISQIVSAEIFSDFMEMANHLLEHQYKDPAAVIIGSVLEEHIRQLCKNHGVDTTYQKGANILPKKADTMNADLVKATVYNVLVQKNITAWLDLRNKAAHGQYAEYNIDNVKLMYQGVLHFVSTQT